MNDLMDALHGQVELLSQRFECFTSRMASANEFIAVLCTERVFKRHGVGVQSLQYECNG